MGKLSFVCAAGILLVSLPACSRGRVSAPPNDVAAVDAGAVSVRAAPDAAIDAAPDVLAIGRIDASAPASVGERAEACFADPACGLADARTLFVRADAAREPVDCFRFYYGFGVARDWTRARACFARTIGKCGGSSPDLPIATYVTMLIEAQGGPRDLPSAKSALDGCFEDVTVTSLRDRMQAPSQQPAPDSSYDFCKDNGGTTLTVNDCVALAGKRAEFERQQLAKVQCASLPDAARPLYGKAADAWTRFAAADAWLIHDTERGGTIRTAATMHSQQIREEERQKRIAKLLDYRPKPSANEAALHAAEADLDAARAAMAKAATDGEQRTMIKDAEDTWVVYRDAEIALYVAAFGARFGTGTVSDDVGITLARTRIAILHAEARGLPDYSSADGSDASAP